MPKQLYKITQFHGGLNSNSDARDIAENELSEATDIMVDELGKIRLIGSEAPHVSGSPEDDQATGWTGTLIPGYGLFQFSHDRTGAEDKGSSEAVTGDDYLAIYDGNDGQVWIYSRVANVWNDDAAAANTGVIDIGSSNTSTAEVNFYTVDGAMRICDGNFSNSNTNKWYGYINRKHFILINLNDGTGVNDGDTLYTYSSWYSKDTEPAAPTAGLIGDYEVTSVSNSAADMRTSAGLTPRFLEGTCSASGNTTTLKNAAASPLTDGGFDGFLAAEIDDIDYNVLNFNHNRHVTITSLDDENTLTTATMSDSWVTSDTYSIYPPTGNGFNLRFNTTASGTFTTSVKYLHFALSYVYDGTMESDLYEYATMTNNFKYPALQIGANRDFSMKVNASAPYDPRISGARVYYREVDVTGVEITNDWLFLADIDLAKGMRNDLYSSTYTPWNINVNWTDASNRLYIYVYKNFTQQSTLTRTSVIGYDVADQTSSIKYKTAVTSNRRSYIGNVKYTDSDSLTHTKGDAIIKSPVNSFDVFPTSGLVETSVNDGDSIVKLNVYADRLLIFKKNKLELLNISQEIEFLEDTFMHKGVSHPAATCKTDFGIAWVNKQGCYLYDGQKVNNLLEKQGRQIIKESDWATFTTNEPMIGYIPKKRQLLVVDDNTATGAGKTFLYDLVTQSWIKGAVNTITSQALTNFITDWNGDLVYAHTSGTVVKWDDAADESPYVDIKTKDIDFGNPGQDKRIYKFYITHRGDASNIKISYYINGDQDTYEEGGMSKLPVTSAVTDWLTTELTPSTSPFSCKSIRLKLFSNGTTPANFEINDITIVFRLKGQR